MNKRRGIAAVVALVLAVALCSGIEAQEKTDSVHGVPHPEPPVVERVHQNDQDFLLKEPALVGVQSMTDCAVPVQRDVYQSGWIARNDGRWVSRDQPTVEHLDGGGIRYYSLQFDAWVDITGSQRISVVYDHPKCEDAFDRLVAKAQSDG